MNVSRKRDVICDRHKLTFSFAGGRNPNAISAIRHESSPHDFDRDTIRIESYTIQARCTTRTLNLFPLVCIMPHVIYISSCAKYSRKKNRIKVEKQLSLKNAENVLSYSLKKHAREEMFQIIPSVHVCASMLSKLSPR